MSETIRGACSCGAVHFELRPPSRFCAHCHCQNCRRAHGAAFVTFIGFKKEQVTIEGQDNLTHFRSDTAAIRSFCKHCGSTLFYSSSRWPDEWHVACANVSGKLDREPSAHVYVDHKAEWWQIDDRLPCFGGPTGTEPKK